MLNYSDNEKLRINYARVSFFQNLDSVNGGSNLFEFTQL